MRISYNYEASEALSQGQLVAFDSTNTEFNHRFVKLAKVGSQLIGIVASDVEKGFATSVYGLVVGQAVPVYVSEAVSKGDRLALDADGKVVAYDNVEGEDQLPLVTMDTISAAGMVDCVCVPVASGAVDGDLEVAGDLDVSGDITGKLAKLGDTAAGYSVGSATQPVYFNAGVPIACSSVGGASFDVGSDGLIPVGSYGLVAFFSSGSMAWTVNAGETATVTSVHVARVPQLSTIAGTGSGACFFQQTAGQTDYPTGTTFTALTTIICAANNGNALALVKRTA